MASPSSSPSPPWRPAGPAPTPGPAGDPIRRAVLVAAGLVGGAAVLLVGWWIVGVATLGGVQDDRCSTSLPDGPFATALGPVHVLAGLLLVGALAVLATARARGTALLLRLGAPLALALAVVGLTLLAQVYVVVALAGLVVLPVAVVVAGVLLVTSPRRGPAAWSRRAVALEVLTWPALVCGLGLDAVIGTLTYADLFCF